MATVKISELPSGQDIGIASNGEVAFSSTTSGAGTKDVSLARQSAGRVIVTDGTATGTGEVYANRADFGGYSGGNFQIKFRIAGSNASCQLGSGGTINWFSGSEIGSGNIDTNFQRYAAGVVQLGDGSSGIRGLIGGGAAVASATALPLPTGRVFHVTGTTNITSITSTNFAAGCVITLIFDGVLTFTDGSNLKLNGNFVTSADDTITLVYDGSNWYEMCRSAN